MIVEEIVIRKAAAYNSSIVFDSNALAITPSGIHQPGSQECPLNITISMYVQR